MDQDTFLQALEQQQQELLALQQKRYLLGLIQRAAGQDEATLRQWLQSNNAEMRFGAAFVIGEKRLPLPQELILALRDRDVFVQQAARRSLILLANGILAEPNESAALISGRVKTLMKLGPKATANKKIIDTASQKWTDWWDENDPSLAKLRNTSFAARYAENKERGR